MVGNMIRNLATLWFALLFFAVVAANSSMTGADAHSMMPVKVDLIAFAQAESHKGCG